MKTKRVNTNPPPLLSGIEAPKNINDAKRILSKLISGFIRGEIEDTKAKTLCYLLTVYVSVIRETELEKRISEIEKTIEGEK